ncbi:MAG: hypothetical protein H0X04_07065, partial [Chthoniobacterales bacterium]|nr:hypothetical protein [Chthoniobacterales bacterium]
MYETQRTAICIRLKRFTIFSLALVAGLSASGQETPSPAPAAADETIIPTYETQKLARAYVLDIPAPRGQIVDRNGVPLAQNRLSYNLAFSFPTPLEFA